MMLSVPNALGYIRIALGAVFFLVAWQGLVFVASVIFLIAMATDVLDGYLARKLMQESKEGIILDAVSDKLVLTAAFAFILLRTDLSAWVAWIAIGYHALTSFGLVILYANRKKILKHSWSGKLAAVTQTAVVPAVLLGWYLTAVGAFFVWLMVVANLFSAGLYAYLGIRAMKR